MHFECTSGTLYKLHEHWSNSSMHQTKSNCVFSVSPCNTYSLLAFSYDTLPLQGQDLLNPQDWPIALESQRMYELVRMRRPQAGLCTATYNVVLRRQIASWHSSEAQDCWPWRTQSSIGTVACAEMYLLYSRNKQV